MEGTIVPVVLRLALAAVIFPHAAQKVLGWFGAWSLDALVASGGNA